MHHFAALQRIFLVAHIAAMFFGLAGLIWVLPHPDFILSLPSVGQRLFGLSMAGGGVVYILLGAIAVALYGFRTLGAGPLLRFMIPAISLSLLSELLGTSTGFPFGHYAYLDGLGYKIAGLVPFTIPLSWFYVGFSAYLLAYSGLEQGLARWSLGNFQIKTFSVGLGAVLLTAWDLVLDPAMSQARFPFWEFQEAGAFFGMPYRNLAGWVGTAMVFMGIGSLLLRAIPLHLTRDQLRLPLVIYLANFTFGAIITLTQLNAPFWIPTALGILIGVIPAVLCWWTTSPNGESASVVQVETESLQALTVTATPQKG
jgi:uncharacterized membrane protein